MYNVACVKKEGPKIYACNEGILYSFSVNKISLRGWIQFNLHFGRWITKKEGWSELRNLLNLHGSSPLDDEGAHFWNKKN